MGSVVVLYSFGLVWKVEYWDNGCDDFMFYGEIKIVVFSNIFYFLVVLFVMDILFSVKEVVSDEIEEMGYLRLKFEKIGDEENIFIVDFSVVLGCMKFNLGFCICW